MDLLYKVYIGFNHIYWGLIESEFTFNVLYWWIEDFFLFRFQAMFGIQNEGMTKFEYASRKSYVEGKTLSNEDDFIFKTRIRDSQLRIYKWVLTYPSQPLFTKYRVSFLTVSRSIFGLRIEATAGGSKDVRPNPLQRKLNYIYIKLQLFFYIQ